MYNNLNIRHFATRRGKKFLSLVVFVCLYLCSFSQAKLLNPDGTQWTANGRYDCAYLKARISYLCYAEKYAASKGQYMKSFQRISKARGEEITSDPSNYTRRTCLSISFDKEWVTNLPDGYTRNIDSDYPAIVYAYSVNAGTFDEPAFDIYYYVSDDLTPTPSDDDDIIFP